MITGIRFPAELETNKDLVVYRKYIDAKALEPKSDYASLIPPTIVAGILGVGVGHLADLPRNQKLKMGAGIAILPALLGYGMKRWDDTEINRARALTGKSDEVLEPWLDKYIERQKTTPPIYTHINRHMFQKQAAKVIKPLIGAALVGGTLVGGSIIVSKAMSPERWERTNKTPEERWRTRVVPQIKGAV